GSYRFGENFETMKTIVGSTLPLLQRMSRNKINYMTFYVKDKSSL
ncbi:unnamed protein product, partial [Brassica napus]